MTATVETSLWLALKSRIDTLVTDPAMTVYDPGDTFTPPSDSTGPLPYILASDVRNDSERITIGGDIHRRSGTLMLALCWPISRAITHTQIMQIAGAIAAHFSADTTMRHGYTYIWTVKDADTLQPYRDGTNIVCIVRVPWRTD